MKPQIIPNRRSDNEFNQGQPHKPPMPVNLRTLLFLSSSPRGGSKLRLAIPLPIIPLPESAVLILQKKCSHSLYAGNQPLTTNYPGQGGKSCINRPLATHLFPLPARLISAFARIRPANRSATHYSNTPALHFPPLLRSLRSFVANLR